MAASGLSTRASNGWSSPWRSNRIWRTRQKSVVLNRPLAVRWRPMREITDRLIGLLTVFASAFCFYYSTVVIRWSQAEAAIDPAYFAFFRFLAGFCVVCAVMAIGGRPPRPRRYGLLVGRAVANSVAVYCFYMAVKYTSVAEANILHCGKTTALGDIELKDESGGLIAKGSATFMRKR